MNDLQGHKKSNTQGSLNSFVIQKPNFGSFGGVVMKKKADDKKVEMKNIFGWEDLVDLWAYTSAAR